MNQHLIIVFIAFLLVTVLLLLLLADGREKSRRLRVLVDLDMTPEADRLRDLLHSCFRQISREHPFLFVFAGETGVDGRPTRQSALRLTIALTGDERNRFHLQQQAPSAILLILDPLFMPKDNPDFIQQLSSALLTAAGIPWD